MSILIFAIIVLLITSLVIWAIQTSPLVAQPINWVLQLLVILVAILLISQRGGFI